MHRIRYRTCLALLHRKQTARSDDVRERSGYNTRMQLRHPRLSGSGSCPTHDPLLRPAAAFRPGSDVLRVRLTGRPRFSARRVDDCAARGPVRAASRRRRAAHTLHPAVGLLRVARTLPAAVPERRPRPPPLAPAQPAGWHLLLRGHRLRRARDVLVRAALWPHADAALALLGRGGIRLPLRVDSGAHGLLPRPRSYRDCQYELARGALSRGAASGPGIDRSALHRECGDLLPAARPQA